MNKIRKYTAGLLSVLCLSASSCDVLDVEPTGRYSETTAYSSLSNLDLYVKYFYGVLYANADINCGSSCLMDDGVTDLVKYSWYNVSAGTVNKFFYQPNFVTEQSNFRSNWSAMYTWISKLNEYLEDLNKTKEVLNNLDLYDMKGGLLMVEDRLAGFSLGEVLGDTLFIHIEKADREIFGAYQMLVSQFAQAYAGEGVSFLNREDDVGDPGLRTSKLSYHPVALLEKYVVTVPDPVLALPDARP